VSNTNLFYAVEYSSSLNGDAVEWSDDFSLLKNINDTSGVATVHLPINFRVSESGSDSQVVRRRRERRA
jgi:hypothetical protein